MNEIIPITNTTIEGMEKLTCDARALHTFLESKQDYSTWIKNRIDKYSFVEGVDFLLHKIVEQNSETRGGHNRIDYALTLDMAKELAMVENNERGREVRRYFIACERRAREVSQQTPKSMYEYAKELVAEHERRELAEAKLDYLKPETPYGTPSKRTGRPRTKLVKPYYRDGWRCVKTTTEVIEWQRRLFD